MGDTNWVPRIKQHAETGKLAGPKDDVFRGRGASRAIVKRADRQVTSRNSGLSKDSGGAQQRSKTKENP